jgi:chemotaxis response regulator CheB
LLAVKNHHGTTFIQDPDSAVVFGMAGVAQSLGAVEQVVKLDDIAGYLLQLISRSPLDRSPSLKKGGGIIKGRF